MNEKLSRTRKFPNEDNLIELQFSKARMDLHLKEQRREHLWEEQKGGDDKQSCRLRMWQKEEKKWIHLPYVCFIIHS